MCVRPGWGIAGNGFFLCIAVMLACCDVCLCKYKGNMGEAPEFCIKGSQRGPGTAGRMRGAVAALRPLPAGLKPAALSWPPSAPAPSPGSAASRPSRSTDAPPPLGHGRRGRPARLPQALRGLELELLEGGCRPPRRLQEVCAVQADTTPVWSLALSA